MKQTDRELLTLFAEMMNRHISAVACHCECLGMNAENCAAICIGSTTPYNDSHYYQVMQKWKLIDEKGEPKI